ncbi:MAG TPA: Cof-type HAD-IIB family hydrolase [Candidatus Nanopelagicales bacterium]
MTRKAIFLDIDGTLANHRGVVPDSAREAVRRARANGHLVFVCTGRSLAELWDHILAVGFDGVIAAAGGYVEHDGQVLSHVSVPVQQVRRVVEYFDAHGVQYFLEANSGLYGSAGLKERLHELAFAGVTDETLLAELERGIGPFIDSVIVDGDPVRYDINKISFLDSPVPLDEVDAVFGDAFTVIPATVPVFGPNSGELAIPGVHKADAIALLLDHLGIDLADTMAYGDGHNDLEMLKHVAVGVAMADAVPELLAVADEVTASADDDGLLASFTAHGLV